MAPKRLLAVVLTSLSLFSSLTLAHPRSHSPATRNLDDRVCQNPVSPFDYSAKPKRSEAAPVCDSKVHAAELFARQTQTDDDYSCSESKPCRNGACCPKKTGFCNYGPEACGTSGQSPNEVCWSNCNAKAECGEFADPPGKKCPLNVCCSKYGFCGMTEEFCDKGTTADPGCQSNCDQPGSGASGGNVQNRVIGYYEAWAHNRKCQGMDFRDIPAGALTHLFFSFGYITPGTFQVAPMDDLSPDLFTDLTNVKRKNSGLKAVVALGGWTFNDNGTATQPVFSDMVSSAANRAKFIGNLFAFMRQYAFDGVDFDWEYPGAPDRGGRPDDGKNFVQFLQELDAENKKQPMKYIVSFTVPTSYWYLRWFDLKAVDYVDFVNVMSYDLHGVWDSTNPIGSHVYAHTNLTEIRLAFDLFWRNKVKADKMNLGLGFYGRSFQLSDPTCYKPGCNFKGGASPGGCSKNSGTLTYKEIQQIVKSKNLKPYHDKEAAVKYITWDQDQWVSYDDQDTFKAKIDFANKLGLGGLLIWAIDQDTDELDALKAVLAPKTIAAFASDADDASYWDDATVPDCYVSDCGGTCKPGFIKVTNQPCGGARPITRHSTEDDSLLCCPLAGAPNADECRWRGTAPLCNGHCQDNEVTLQLNRWGDGKYCEDGNKAYCCDSPDAKENKCYWAGVGSKCNGDDTTMTFSGTFLSTVADIAEVATLVGNPLAAFLDEIDMELQKRYCCPKDDAKNWQNCKWYGEPSSCFDNHCPVGHAVQLTDSHYGLGQSCFPRLERSRVFCCDPSGGQSPFLPVPLKNLFPRPPEGDNVDTDFDLNVDETFGTNDPKTDNEPGNASFQFVVLTSPEELQVSLDKRDGSHWEIFGCDDAISEDEHTVQMFCTDISETSNCHKIGLGHGVPGTIIEMPAGCGPGRYAVAISMSPSTDQVLPPELRKRALHMPVVYDLKFDYNFHRVPRDLGDTQMRIDFSNKDNYWDEVVAAAASKKRKAKRSLADFGGSHKKWLEAEWRDDLHHGALSREELHKRWFGSDILAWLSRLVSPEIKREFTHDVDEQIIAKIIDDKVKCGAGDAQFDGHILVQALTDIKVSTSFGFTLITTLNPSGLDLSQSFLTFSNRGKVSATFTLEALARVTYDTGDREIVTLPFPGASFRVPGIVTIGPSVRVVGRFDAGLALSAEIETKVEIASWDVQQTLPSDKAPDVPDRVDAGDTGNPNGLQQPQFYAAVKAEGKVEAHLKAMAEFGIRFDDRWKVGAAAAGVVADGYVRFEVGVGKSTEANCPWTYGLTLGAALYAQVEVPTQFGWPGKRWDLPGSGEVPIIPGGKCPDLRPGSPTKRGLVTVNGGEDFDVVASSPEMFNRSMHRLSKRATPWGPPFHIPLQSLICPNPSSTGTNSGTKCEELTGWEEDRRDSLSRRAVGDLSNLHRFEKRGRDNKKSTFCSGGQMNIWSPIYDSSSSLHNNVNNNALTFAYTNPQVCTDFGFGRVARPQNVLQYRKYATEHIFEFQLIPIFFDYLKDAGFQCPDPKPGPNQGRPTDICKCMKPLWFDLTGNQWPTVNGEKLRPMDLIAAELPGSDNSYSGELVLLDWQINAAKEGMWGRNQINSDTTMHNYQTQDPDRAFKNIKDVITALRYHSDATVNANLLAQRNRIGARLELLDTAIVPTIQKPNHRTWTAVGLRAQWDEWTKTRALQAHEKAIAYIDDYRDKLDLAYATQYQRENAQQGGDDPQAVASRALIAKIDALNNEWKNNRPNWVRPF